MENMYAIWFRSDDFFLRQMSCFRNTCGRMCTVLMGRISDISNSGRVWVGPCSNLSTTSSISFREDLYGLHLLTFRRTSYQRHSKIGLDECLFEYGIVKPEAAMFKKHSSFTFFPTKGITPLDHWSGLLLIHSLTLKNLYSPNAQCSSSTWDRTWRASLAGSWSPLRCYRQRQSLSKS